MDKLYDLIKTGVKNNIISLDELSAFAETLTELTARTKEERFGL